VKGRECKAEQRLHLGENRTVQVISFYMTVSNITHCFFTHVAFHSLFWFIAAKLFCACDDCASDLNTGRVRGLFMEHSIIITVNSLSSGFLPPITSIFSSYQIL